MFISVIIPTYNKKNLLVRTLDHLKQQTLSKDAYEVIIVDDGSNDATTEYMQAYRQDNEYVRYFKKSRSGPADSRNFGLKQAKGDIIAFTDDDCIIPFNWLENIQRAFLEDSMILGVEGQTLTFFNRVHPLTHQVVNIAKRKGRVFPTCNVAYRKEILERVGGFYNKFKYPHNEDVDFGWSVLEHGEILFDQSVVVIHPAYYRSIFKKLTWSFYLRDEFILYNRHRALYKKLRSRNPWTLIYYHIYFRNNFLFGLSKYLKYRKLRIFSLLSLKIIIFIILQGLWLIILAPYFVTKRKEQ